MRVLLTTDTIGGVWTFTRELSTELLRGGHTVILVSFGRSPSAAHLEWTDATFLAYPSTFRYVPSLAPLEWMQQNGRTIVDGMPVLLRVIHESQPDIVHTSQFCFGRLRASIPVVVTAHSDVISWAEACDPSVLKQTPWLDRYRKLVQNGLDYASAVVAPTRWMLDELRRNFMVGSYVRVIYNGRTVADQVSASSRSRQAVSAGRFWDKAKNLSLLAKQVNTLPILVAGEMSPDDVGRPEWGCLQFLGHLDERALLSLFRSSSLYIGPSIYEPFGLAPLEAALCGCALVLMDIPSFREIWGDAALYTRDAVSLGELLSDVLSSEKHLAEKQKDAYEAASHLTSRRMADEYLAVYEQALNPIKETASAF